MSTKDEAMTVSPNGQQTDVSRSYLVLYENNPDRISGSIEKFDAQSKISNRINEIISFIKN